ncbi:ABC transporter ATP-binding protein, partial [Gammaproteobacteria bacterium]|nr:ABC transporter ATP-binding protein [Gammaproteobacteria bacterium]
DFEIAAGERVAIIGASGSGKTTLLNLLGGIDKPTSGKVLIAGQDVSTLRAKQQDKVRNQTLGFVYQFHHLLGEFSAQENVAMPLIIAGKEYTECMAKAAELLQQVGLAERLKHKPSQLSGGERQRVAIARAFANEPSCVLMDEPTGNLDRHTAEAIHQLMRHLNEKFMTSFIVVTHDQNLADQMDRVLLLQDSMLIAQQESVSHA